MSATYTPDDLAAWRVVHPYDEDLPDELVVSMVSFQWFVFSRRLYELGQAVRDVIDPALTILVRWLR